MLNLTLIQLFGGFKGVRGPMSMDTGMPKTFCMVEWCRCPTRGSIFWTGAGVLFQFGVVLGESAASSPGYYCIPSVCCLHIGVSAGGQEGSSPSSLGWVMGCAYVPNDISEYPVFLSHWMGYLRVFHLATRRGRPQCSCSQWQQDLEGRDWKEWPALSDPKWCSVKNHVQT